MTQRARDLADIRSLYGVDDSLGREMLLAVAARHLLKILPDEAIHELAEMHRAYERRQAGMAS